MSINVDPLSDEEFEELDEFLLSLSCADDAMTMDVLHGFLTALVIGPETVPVSEWMPHVWGADPACKPQFKSTKEESRITDLILRFMNEIAITFDVAPKEYEPLFCEQEWDGKMLIDAEGWAMGFWEGLNLRPTAWKAIWTSDSATLMQPFYLLGAEEIDDDEAPLIDDPLKLHKLAIQMEANILPIRRFWMEQARAPQADERSDQPASRKSGEQAGPCACGSGKKFKQCCGATPTLH